MTPSEPTFAVLTPEGILADDFVAPTEPVADLRTVRIAQLWDWRFKGDRMFEIVGAELEARYPGVEFVPFEVFGDTHSSDPSVSDALIDLLREHGCDAVISAVGA
jgi:hypothetical protein